MAKKAKKLPSSLITLLLDRSGSMGSCRAATIEAFNAYLAGLKAEKEATIDFTFLQFDSVSLDKVCVRQPIAGVANLTMATYEPRGGTPLVDSAFDTITATATAVAEMPAKTRVVIAIQTDGAENESRRHTFEELATLIKAKQELGWEFVFLGAGINAYDQGAKMGIAATSTMSYDHTNEEATRYAFAESAMNSANFAAGRSQTTAYSGVQRSLSGDRFASADLMQDVQTVGIGKMPAQPLNLSQKRTLTPAKTSADLVL